jgi:hypothetical protein
LIVVELSLHPFATPGIAHRPQASAPVLSFFTGAGFLDLGFIQAGFEIVWHNEYSKSFAQGFQQAVQSPRAKRPWWYLNGRPGGTCWPRVRRPVTRTS